MRELLDAAYFAKRGTWPEGGGLNDQTESCVRGVKLVWREREHWKARTKRREED